jgi:hypothetical protein
MMKEFMSASVFTASLAAFATAIPAHARLNGAHSGGAYLISEFKVTDAEGLRAYRQSKPPSRRLVGALWFEVARWTHSKDRLLVPKQS